jgi:hypothetical protein
MQSKLVSDRLAAVTWVSGRPEDALAMAPWGFAVLLLGLAIALVIIAATFPEIFVASFNHFGPDTP